MIALDFSTFIGHFHPVFVHLPIGFLMLAVLLEWFENFKKSGNKSPLIVYAWLLGGISGAIAAFCGWFLGETGLYMEDDLFVHRWLGIALVLVAFAGWWIKKNPSGHSRIIHNGINILLLGMLLVEGHKGGGLTHGDGYLTEYAPLPIQNILGVERPKDTLPSLGNPDSVMVYRDLILPIFESKCIVCHGTKVQRGGLNIENMEAFQKGGEGGPVLTDGNVQESELFRRITLPQRNAKYMPPTGDAMTYDEIKTVEWWITQGNSYDKYVSDLVVTENIKPVLLRRYGLDTNQKPWYMTVKLKPVDSLLLVKLEQAGFSVRNLGADNPLLDIKYNGVTLSKEQLSNLSSVKDHITWLSLAGTNVEDEWLGTIADFANLTRLQLEKTNISDKGVALLSKLEHLEALNLYGTKVTDSCLGDIKNMTGLKRVYLWGTKVTAQSAKNMEESKENLEVILGEG